MTKSKNELIENLANYIIETKTLSYTSKDISNALGISEDEANRLATNVSVNEGDKNKSEHFYKLLKEGGYPLDPVYSKSNRELAFLPNEETLEKMEKIKKEIEANN